MNDKDLAMSRRKVLKVSGAAGLVGVAGCSGDGGDSDTTPTQDDQGDGGTTVGSTPSSVDETYRLGHEGPPETLMNLQPKSFKNNIEEKSGGDITIEIHHSAALGGAQEMVEQVRSGNLAFSTTEVGAATYQEPNVVLYPYLWDSPEHAVRGGDPRQSEVAKQWHDRLQDEFNIKYFGVENIGIRNALTTGRACNVEDFQGMDLRSGETDFYQTGVIGIGANPVVLPFQELNSAMATGQVSGADLPADIAFLFNAYAEASHFIHTRHMTQALHFFMSDDMYQELPSEYQNMIVEAWDEAVAEWTPKVLERQRHFSEQLANEGIKIIVPEGYEIDAPDDMVEYCLDLEGLKENTESVAQDRLSEFQGVVEKLREV